MSISGSNSVPGFSSVRPAAPTPPSARPQGVDPAKPEAAPLSAPRDEVEISSAGRLMQEGTTGSAEMRAERLARIKAAIDDGTYETTEKLEAALGRMIDRIAGED